MTEAAKALTAFAFRELGVRRVEALTDEENVRARRVCARAGFTLEGTLRHYRASPDGLLRNACVYAIVQ
jgi:RimJ/RimL family protein N-acetyltransferase